MDRTTPSMCLCNDDSLATPWNDDACGLQERGVWQRRKNKSCKNNKVVTCCCGDNLVERDVCRHAPPSQNHECTSAGCKRLLYVSIRRSKACAHILAIDREQTPSVKQNLATIALLTLDWTHEVAILLRRYDDTDNTRYRH